MWSVRQREALGDDQEINSNNMYIFLYKVKYQGIWNNKIWVENNVIDLLIRRLLFFNGCGLCNEQKD